MPRLEQPVAVAPVLVFRAHPLKDLGQEEDRGALAQELLHQPLLHDPLAEVSGPNDLEQMVLERVVVDAAIESVDVVDHRVQLDRVERA